MPDTLAFLVRVYGVDTCPQVEWIRCRVTSPLSPENCQNIGARNNPIGIVSWPILGMWRRRGNNPQAADHSLPSFQLGYSILRYLCDIRQIQGMLNAPDRTPIVMASPS